MLLVETKVREIVDNPLGQWTDNRDRQQAINKMTGLEVEKQVPICNLVFSYTSYLLFHASPFLASSFRFPRFLLCPFRVLESPPQIQLGIPQLPQ